MKEFQKKLQNKKCTDASKAQCAPETTNPALLAEKTLHKSNLHTVEGESGEYGCECCCLLSADLAADRQYTHESPDII